MTYTHTTETILSAVRDRFGIALFEAHDANGAYLHGRLDGGAWVVATDACDCAMTLRGRLEDERERREYWVPVHGEGILGIGWSVGIYRNCTRCGDDHPADHDDDGCLWGVVDDDDDTTADKLPDVIARALDGFATMR